MLAPIFGGFTVKTLVWAGDGHLILWYSCLLGVGVERVLLDETHHPIILVKRAEELRRRTGNWGFMLHTKN